MQADLSTLGEFYRVLWSVFSLINEWIMNKVISRFQRFLLKCIVFTTTLINKLISALQNQAVLFSTFSLPRNVDESVNAM